MTMRSSLARMSGYLCTVFQGLLLHSPEPQKAERLADDALPAVGRVCTLSRHRCLSAVSKPSASDSTDCSTDTLQGLLTRATGAWDHPSGAAWVGDSGHVHSKPRTLISKP